MNIFQRLFGGRLPQKPTEKPLREAAGTTISDDDEGWRRLTGDTLRDLTPITQHRAREISAWLWQSNNLANRLIELPMAFMLADGVSLKSKDTDAQKTLSAFWSDPINAWDLKLPRRVRELSLYGEQCYPAFVNEHSGDVRLGYLDPSLIQEVITDPDNPEQPIGIVTARDKKGRYRRMRVIVNGPDEDLFTQRTQDIRAGFSDGECFYFAVNALSSGVRGRPDLLPQADWLDAYDDFLFGEVDRTRFLRAFVWDVTLKGADAETVKKRSSEIAPPGPNSVRVHNDSETWDAVSPDLGAADTGNTGRLLRNHVLGGATIPEHWFGGGGDVNRATGESMGDPAVKIFSMRQRELKHILESIGTFVLRQKFLALHGKEPKRTDPAVQCTACFPEMVARDASRYAAALQAVVAAAATAVDRKLITPKTALSIIASVAAYLGVEIDVETELSAALKNGVDAASQDVFTDPLAGTGKAGSLRP